MDTQFLSYMPYPHLFTMPMWQYPTIPGYGIPVMPYPPQMPGWPYPYTPNPRIPRSVPPVPAPQVPRQPETPRSAY
ncbi:hypothetical protein IC619_012455 [Hazenella sp. IB182353]|uniref:hypothetical protein n=1 Tax=Polycladospora coralii TaxID=2771432 RepID=UPI001746B6E7|nr:hypothetical protein [Polycladospora coralii]MBS7531304.1 hypothetical protein [Polycladospora coralii]